jgi:hypothetical protein
MARAAEGGKLGLEYMNFRALNELAMRQNARHRVIDRPAQPAALRSNIDKRDRPFFNPGVLIHFSALNACSQAR